MTTPNKSESWTDEALRVAIAEACGWKYGNLAGANESIVRGYSNTGWFEPDGQHHDTAPPNYPSSLDACHEIEKVLTDDQFGQYENEVKVIVWRGKGNIAFCNREVSPIHATARQKSESFVKTLSLSPSATNTSAIRVVAKPNESPSASTLMTEGEKREGIS